MKSYPVEKARHIVLRAAAGETLPADLTLALIDQEVSCGWLRASGVLADVELRAFDPALGAPAEPRRITGPVQALSIEGSVGLERGMPTIGLRAVLARETDRGMEVLAGEIVSARVIALEAFVTAFEDLALGRALDAHANVTLFGDGPVAPRAVAATVAARVPVAAPVPVAASVPAPVAVAAPVLVPAPIAVAAPATSWTEAVVASVEVEVARQAVNRGALGGAIPARPARVQREYDEALVPEAGDAVEHFAFGAAEVVKSEGDRLHLRAGKDGRIREIALEMLKVTPLTSDGPNRRFRLDRKM